MISVQEARRCFWRNRYAPGPGLEVALVSANRELEAAVAPEILRALIARWPGLIGAENSASQMIAAVADALRPGRGGNTTVHNATGSRATLFIPDRDMAAAEAAVRSAVQLVGLRAPQMAPRVIEEAIAVTSRIAFDQTTCAMITEAERRDIPWTRLMRFSRHVLIGQGARQHIIRESMPDIESSTGREIAKRKILTLAVLHQVGLPVGHFMPVDTADGALRAAQQIGYPLVLKPNEGEKGRGVHAGLRNSDELRAAIAQLPGLSDFLVQSHFPGEDHRLLVIDGKLISAAKRVPASVTGDGKRTIVELVEEENRDARRGSGFTNLMNTIVLDAKSDQVLARSGLNRNSVPASGQTVRLKSTANIATGGTAEDVTGIIHRDNARAAVKAAKALGLKIAGVDFLSPDISRSWRDVGGGICEVNTIVGVRPHWLSNPAQNVIAPIFDTFVRPGDDLRIPTAMITGTKGKTTTCLMLADILTAAGHGVGAVTSIGITVDGEQLAKGDYIGFTGAERVLRDPMTTAAVLETGRGGLLLNGTYLDRCDVSAVLNIGREQIGMDGVETLDDMAAVKRKVLDAAHKAVVLNADDALCRVLLAEFHGKLRTIAFTLGPENIEAGEAVTLYGGDIVHRHDGVSETIVAVSKIPAAMNGLITANIQNAMAAIALALGMGVGVAHIRSAMRGFENSVAKTHGRFNFVDDFPLKVLFDYAGDPVSLAASVEVANGVTVSGKRFCAVTAAGNRPDWFFAEIARALAGHFDRYIFYGAKEWLRGRKPGEMEGIFRDALIKEGVQAEAITQTEDFLGTCRLVAAEAKPDDFAVMFGSNMDSSVDELRRAFSEKTNA